MGRGLLLAALIVLGVAAISEVVFRVVKPYFCGKIRQPLIYEPDDNLGYRYMPHGRGRIVRYFDIDNLVTLNKHGFHDTEWHLPSRAQIRVMTVGDSFTACIHVSVRQTWTQRLQKAMLNQGISVRLFNCGVDGTGTDVHFKLFETLIPLLNPTHVIVAFYPNDIREARRKTVFRRIYRDNVLMYQTDEHLMSLERLVHNVRRNSPWPFLFERFFVFRLICSGISRGRSPLRTNFYTLNDTGHGVIERDPKNPESRCYYWLKSIARLAREKQIVPYFVPCVTRSGAVNHVNYLRRHIPKWARENVVDPGPAVRRILRARGVDWCEMFWKHDRHYNDLGNRLFAEALYDLLIDGMQATASKNLAVRP